MSGNPEKILEHFLETMRLESGLNEVSGNKGATKLNLLLMSI